MPDNSSNNAASAFKIREVTGDKREVQLIGRALPYRPFSLATGQRTKLSSLPGFAEKTATTLGAEDDPNGISLDGYWKDKYLDTIGEFAAETGQAVNSSNFAPFTLNGMAITNVKDATDFMESFSRFGQELEITWLNKIRRCLLKAFEEHWYNEHDVEWTMKFDVLGRGEGVGKSLLINGPSLADSSNAINAAYVAFNDVAVPTNFGIKPDLLSSIGSIGRGVEDAMYSMENVIEGAANAISLPVRAAKALDGICRTIETEVGFMGSYIMGRLAMDFHAEHPGPLQSFTERLETSLWQRQFYGSGQEFRRIAVDQRTQQKAQNESDIMGVYVARDGDDLRDVAAQFYDDEWEWRRIQQFNGLSSSELHAGQQVKVPRINPQNPDDA